MIKVFVDSGSSIKQDEKELYNVDIIPLKVLLNGKEYLDGLDLTMDVFYDELINNNQFPKTSLPDLGELEDKVKKYVDEGHDVIILTISSGISGTYNAMNLLFQDEPKVHIVDSETACGGMKILVREINKYGNESIEFILEKLGKLIPRIRVYAVPETLAYLHKGGRLSKLGYTAATLFRIKPVIELRKTVSVSDKTLGIKKAMNEIVAKLENCDINYPIVPSYTYKPDNLNELISRTSEKYKEIMIEFDDIDPAIAAHWGPNACGYIFVEKE